MPVTKLPLIHKFGIISNSQRLQLQERLLQQQYSQHQSLPGVIQGDFQDWSDDCIYSYIHFFLFIRAQFFMPSLGVLKKSISFRLNCS
jgi:hypothetical protein